MKGSFAMQNVKGKTQSGVSWLPVRRQLMRSRTAHLSFYVLPFAFLLPARQAEAAGGDDVPVDLARAGGDRQGDARLVVVGGATVQWGVVAAGDELAGEAERVD